MFVIKPIYFHCECAGTEKLFSPFTFRKKMTSDVSIFTAVFKKTLYHFYVFWKETEKCDRR